MVGLVLVVVASGLSVLTLEAVAESAPSGARDLVVFGHEIAAPGSPGGTWILIGLAVSAALAWSAAVAWSRGHRLERRMAAELDARWAELAERDAGDAARRELINWRLAELQTLVDRLLADRQAATRKARHLVVVPDAEAPTVADP